MEWPKRLLFCFYLIAIAVVTGVGQSGSKVRVG